MRALHYGFLLLAVCVLAAINTPRALAQPEPGCDAAYLRGFEIMDSRGRITWRPGEIECIEYFRFNVSTPGGQRTFRAIGDINAGPLLRPGDLARVEAAARRAAGSMAALGDYRVDNVTFLVSLYNAARPGRDGDSTLAWAHDQSRRPANECPVTLFLFQQYEGTGIQDTIAHELFHCVQYRSLTSAQWATYRGFGKWWAEGSAELFATYVGRSTGSTSPHARDFGRQSRAGQPLYSISYPSVVFFASYYQQNGGISALLPFLRRMASTPGEGAQRVAIRSAISDDSLLRFAKDFADEAIKYPSGQAVDVGYFTSASWTISRNDTHRVTLQPFVMIQGTADYSCGVWENRITPSNANAAVRPVFEGAWARPWPSRMDCRQPNRLQHYFTAFNTADANVSMALRVERRIVCESCLPAGENHVDACLVGTWELTGGGPMEWMARRMGRANFRDKNSSKMKVTMFDDGTYRVESQTVAFQTEIRKRNRTSKFDTKGQSSFSGGFWTAKDGKMRACSLGVAAEGTTTETVTTRERTSMHTAPTNFATGPTEGESKYTCSATTYTSSIRMNDGSNMDFTFTRLSPPPPPPIP